MVLTYWLMLRRVRNKLGGFASMVSGKLWLIVLMALMNVSPLNILLWSLASVAIEARLCLDDWMEESWVDDDCVVWWTNWLLWSSWHFDMLVICSEEGLPFDGEIIMEAFIVISSVDVAGFWWLLFCWMMIEIGFEWGKFIWRGRNEEFEDVEFIVWFLTNSFLPLPKILNSWSFLHLFLCFCSSSAGLGKFLHHFFGFRWNLVYSSTIGCAKALDVVWEADGFAIITWCVTLWFIEYFREVFSLFDSPAFVLAFNSFAISVLFDSSATSTTRVSFCRMFLILFLRFMFGSEDLRYVLREAVCFYILLELLHWEDLVIDINSVFFFFAWL